MLEITTRSFIRALRNYSPGTSLRVLLSTVKSPEFSGIFFMYQDGDFYNDAHSKTMQDELEGEEMWYRKQFQAFYEILGNRHVRLTALVHRGGDNPTGELRSTGLVARKRGLTLEACLRFPCRWKIGNTGETLVGYSPSPPPLGSLILILPCSIVQLPCLQDLQDHPTSYRRIACPS